MVLACTGSAQASLTSTPQSWLQTNGRVRAIVSNPTTGLTYIGGSFTTVTPVGGVPQPAAGLAAFTSSGALAFTASFGPSASAQVKALTVSGGVLYAGGAFTTANGQSRRNLAAFNATTGALLGFNPAPNFDVDALASTSTTIYLGGDFTRSSNAVRTHLAAYTHPNSTHWVLTGWNPASSGEIEALLVVTRGVLAGGTFRTIGGGSHTNLALLNAVSGKALPWPSQSSFADVLSLAKTGNLVVAGLGGKGGSVAGYLEPTGTQLWKQWLDGNVAAVAIADGQVVIGGHFRNFCPDGLVTTDVYPGYQCANNDSIERDHVAQLDLTTGTLDPNFAPVLNSKLGVFAELGTPLTSTTQTVDLGGDFTQEGGGSGAVSIPYLAQFATATDTTPPTITQAPAATLSYWSQLTTTTVPLHVTYLGSDDSSGICGYALTQSPALTGSPGLPWLNAEWATGWVQPNHGSTTFTATPTDCAGNVGTPVAGSPVTLGGYSRSGITFGGKWTFPTSSVAFRGVHAVTSEIGASASLTFTGTEVAFVAERGSWTQVAVQIDGHYKKTINLFSTVSDPRRVVYTASWTTPGTHTIRIVLVRGGKTPHINLDRFLVLS
jgi:hypothetical protein